MCLTAAGRTLFARIRKQDAKLVDALFADIPERQQAMTLKTLRELNQRLEEGDLP
jgi:DNA-binding MarR family transcriptional regulator